MTIGTRARRQKHDKNKYCNKGFGAGEKTNNGFHKSRFFVVQNSLIF
jgi:hypothetical protein